MPDEPLLLDRLDEDRNEPRIVHRFVSVDVRLDEIGKDAFDILCNHSDLTARQCEPIFRRRLPGVGQPFESEDVLERVGQPYLTFFVL